MSEVEMMKNFGFTENEIHLITMEFFCNQKGYREIAKILGKKEIRVRKQIAHLMSELVA